jgi:hypothetical protein
MTPAMALAERRTGGDVLAAQRFSVGQTVQVDGFRAYGSRREPVVGTGVVVGVSHRYRGTPGEYYQYAVAIDGHPPPTSSSDLNALFEERALNPIH